MLPPNKTGRVCRKTKNTKERLSSFSSIELDADLPYKGTKMRSLGYKIDAEKLWKNL